MRCYFILQDFIDIVLSKTQRKTPTVIHKQYRIGRIRHFYMRKVKFAQQTFHDKLTMILTEFPKLEVHIAIVYIKKCFYLVQDSCNLPRWVLESTFSVGTLQSFQTLDFCNGGTLQNFHKYPLYIKLNCYKFPYLVMLVVKYWNIWIIYWEHVYMGIWTMYLLKPLYFLYQYYESYMEI
jgi:hypothetical protein